jgi:hypothetical protein
MTLQGNVTEHDWSVSVDVHPCDGGYECLIHVSHEGPGGKFEHQFKHFEVLPTEHEAVLAGLHQGMLWLEQKMSKTFTFSL